MVCYYSEHQRDTKLLQFITAQVDEVQQLFWVQGSV